MPAVLNGATRRRFLFGCAGALAAGCAVGPTPSVPAGLPRTRDRAKQGQSSVIVVGAGLSGLAAALELCERGFDVQVLEATVRPGGRILTIRAPLTQDRYVEAGAAHVINDPALLTLCAQLGLTVSQFAPRLGLRRVSLVGGERRTWPPNAPRPQRWALGSEDEKLGDAGRWQ